MSVSSHTLCFNNVDTIETTLRYAVKSFDEVIIVDGGSTDGTIDIIKKYDVKLFINPMPKELMDQFNFALDKCKCDWTVRLDSDEIFSFSDWNEYLSSLDRLVWQVVMRTYHLQKDLDHYNPAWFKINYLRAWRIGKDIKYLRRESDGGETSTAGPFNMETIQDERYCIHFGHLRSKEKQIEKFRQYEKLTFPHEHKFIDPSEDCLYTRNFEWNKYIEELPDEIKKWIQLFYVDTGLGRNYL